MYGIAKRQIRDTLKQRNGLPYLKVKARFIRDWIKEILLR